MVAANNKIDDNKKCRQIDDNFDGHGNAAVQREAHRPMEHIQASLKATGRLLGECFRRIAPAAAMIDDFE